MEKGILYIVATPIGNLEDMTFRAVRVLKEADLILCEDTRVTRKLLEKYSIENKTKSFHHHTKEEKIIEIMDLLMQGKDIALVTDAGTPGVSDPGNILVEMALEKEIVIVPIPGASAISTIVSVAGIDMQKFVFLGFPPHKKGRETFFKEVVASKYPVMYYESPHRVLKNLELLENLCHSGLPPRVDERSFPRVEVGDSEPSSIDESKNVIVGRELTKMFEQIVRGEISEVIEYFEKNPSKLKGEFVVIAY